MKNMNLLKIAPLSILLVFMGFNSLKATDYTFMGVSGSTTWQAPLNWVDHVVPPTNLPVGDRIFITTNCSLDFTSLTYIMSGTLQVNQNVTLTLKNVVEPDMGFRIMGTVENYGTIDNRTAMTIGASGVITNYGGATYTLKIAQSTLGYLENGGTFNNLTNATFNIDYATGFTNQSGGVFHNNGTFKNDFLFYNLAGSTFNNNGLMTSDNSEGSLTNGGIFNMNDQSKMIVNCTFINQAIFNLKLGSELEINKIHSGLPLGGTFNWYNGGKITLGADFTINGTTLTIPTGAILNIKAGVGLLTIASDKVVDNNGLIINNGSLQVQGTVNNRGSITNLGLTNNTGTVNNFIGGIVYQSGGEWRGLLPIPLNTPSPNGAEGVLAAGVFYLNGGSLLLTSSDAQLPDPSDASFVWGNGLFAVGVGGIMTISTDKAIPANKNFGVWGQLVINEGATLTNNGNFYTLGSIITQVYGSSVINGTLINNSPLTVGAFSQINIGTNGRLTNNSLITSPGNVTNAGILDCISGGFISEGFTTNTGTINISGTGSYIYINNGILRNDGTMNVNTTLRVMSVLTNNGTLNLNGVLELNEETGNSPSLPSGTFNWNNGGIISIGSQTNFILTTNLTIPNGRRLRVFGSMTIESNATLTNQGEFEIYTVINNGTIVNNAQMTPYNDGGLTNYGTLKGTGTQSCSFNNSGIFAPGASPGCYTFTGGNVTYTNGATNIDINGSTVCTEHDQIVNAGVVNVGGVLNVNFGFTPQIGATFQLFRITGGATTYTGSFTTINVTPSTIAVEYDAATGVLSVVVPSPTNTLRSVVNGGSWNSAATWSGNRVPTVNDNVEIMSGHTITIPSTSSGSGICKTLTINFNGRVNCPNNTSLNVGDANPVANGGNKSLLVRGTLAMTGGTVNIAGKLILDGIDYSGVLNIDNASTIRINGNTGVANTSVYDALIHIINSPPLVAKSGTIVLYPHYNPNQSLINAETQAHFYNTSFCNGVTLELIATGAKTFTIAGNNNLKFYAVKLNHTTGTSTFNFNDVKIGLLWNGNTSLDGTINEINFNNGSVGSMALYYYDKIHGSLNMINESCMQPGGLSTGTIALDELRIQNPDGINLSFSLNSSINLLNLQSGSVALTNSNINQSIAIASYSNANPTRFINPNTFKLKIPTSSNLLEVPLGYTNSGASIYLPVKGIFTDCLISLTPVTNVPIGNTPLLKAISITKLNTANPPAVTIQNLSLGWTDAAETSGFAAIRNNSQIYKKAGTTWNPITTATGITTSGSLYFKDVLQNQTIDDPSVFAVMTSVPTCPVPQNIVNQTLGTDNAQFVWDAANNATGYEIEYYTGSNTPTTLTPSTPSVSLTNLAPSTLYHLRVRTNCGNNSFSNWSSYVEFTTPATPTCALTDGIFLYQQAPGTDYVEFGWNAVAGATGYEVEYYTGLNTPTLLTPSLPSAILTNLLPSSLYHFRVRTNCGNSNFSVWSEDQVFTTNSVSVVITSAQNGYWNETTTWVGGVVPTANDDVIIAATHTVQVYNSAANYKNLTLNANSRLDQRGTLIIGGDLTINGTFNHAYDIFNSPFMGSTQIGASNTSAAAGTRLVTVSGVLSVGNGLFGNPFLLAGRMVFMAGSTLDLKQNANITLTGWSDPTPAYLMDIDNLTTLNMDSYAYYGIVVTHANDAQAIISQGRNFAATCNYTNSSYVPFNLAANNTYYFESATRQTIQSIILGQNASLNLYKIELRKLEAISGGNIYSTDGQFSNISAGGGTTLYGDYTLVDNCNTFVPPLFSNTGNLSFDNNMTLKVNVTDYAIMNIPIGASQNVLGTLNIQNGKLIVKGGTLDLRNATVTGLSNTRYFETQVGTSPYNTLGSVLLPAVGTAPVNFNLGITLSNGTSVYAPVNIVSNNGNNNISINLQTLSVPTGYVAPAIKWNITPSAGSSNLTITFTWPASAESILFANNRNSAKVYHYNSNTDTWEELPTSAVTTNSDGSFSVTASNITTFSPFAVMVNNTVLKAELINFTAKANNDQAVLTWQTATETNVKNFDIEKSADGQKFERITEVKAKNTPSLYQAFDNDFSASAYYRLKINDLDGKTDYSKVVFLEKSPFGGKGAKIRSNTEGSVWIETDTQIESIHVVNTIGQVVKTTKDKQFSIADLPKGIYVVVVKTNRGFVSEEVLSPMK